MSEICLVRSHRVGGHFRSGSTTAQTIGFGSGTGTTASRFQKGNGLIKPAAKMLPPTQPRPTTPSTIIHQIYHQQQSAANNFRYGHIAMRARLSPSMSLFNRLDEFVTQLESRRDFFAEWPQNLCHRIRQDAINGQRQSYTRVGTTISQQNINSSSAEIFAQKSHSSIGFSAACWNGLDFGG